MDALKLGLSLIVVATSALTPKAVHAAPSTASPEDIATAREQFRLGSQYAKQGDWNKALDAYKRSLALRPSPLTRYSMAIAQQHLGQWVESMENLRLFLLEDPDQKTAPYRKPAEQALRKAQRKIGRLRITVPGSPRGVRILIDHARVSSAIIGIDRLMNPGVHFIEVTIPGHGTFRTKVRVQTGKRSEVHARFRNADGSEYTGRDQASQRDDDVEPKTNPGWYVLATGAAVFAGGVTFGVLGYRQGLDAERPDDEHADKARTFALIGDLSMGVGLAVTTLGVYFLSKNSCPDQHTTEHVAKVRVAPWIGQSSAGVGLTGGF